MVMADSPAEVEKWTWICVGVMIVEFVVQLNWIVTYYALRDQAPLRKRYPNLVIVINVFSMLLYVSTVLNYIWTQSECCANPFPRWRSIAITLVVFAVCVPNFLHVYRVYLTWFDLGWSQALEDSKWKVNIDNDSQSDRSVRFFLKNRTGLLGNKKVIFLYFLACMISFGVAMIVSVAVIGKGFYSDQSREISQWNIIVPSLHFLLMYFLLPKYDDIWHLRTEIRLLCIGLFLNGLSFVLYVKLSPPIPRTVNYAFFLLVIDQTSIIGASVTMFVVLYRSRLPTNVWSLYTFIQMKKHKNTLHRLQSTSEKSNSGQPKPRPKASDSSLRSIVASKEGFSAFCRHATREFNAENILWLVESEQFIRAHLHLLDVDELRSRLLTIEFAESVPQSTIVNTKEAKGKDDKASLKDIWWQAMQLFEKYVWENAVFGINISSDCRKNLYELFHFSQYNSKYRLPESTIELQNKSDTSPNASPVMSASGSANFTVEVTSTANRPYIDSNSTEEVAAFLSKTKKINDLFTLFDQSRKEVYKIVSLGVFSRFRKTEEYQQLTNERKASAGGNGDNEFSVSTSFNYKVF